MCQNTNTITAYPAKTDTKLASDCASMDLHGCRQTRLDLSISARALAVNAAAVHHVVKRE